MYGTLWAFGTVFAHAISSMASTDPTETTYLICLAIFGVIVVPVSCMELTEQVALQVALCICRLVMIATMIVTIIVADVSHTQPFSDYSPNSVEPAPFFRADFSKIYLLLPIAAYANIFHHSIPVLSQPVENKKKLAHIFGYTILLCLIAYSTIGSVISIYFGNTIKSSSNLMWISFNGYDSNVDTTPVYARVIASYVVCFPGIDVASAFPLCAITLGNNLMSSYYGQNTAEMENDRAARITFRLIAAVPPIFGAALVTSLGRITSFTGITGFLVSFVFPSLLAISSRDVMIRKGLTTETYFSHPMLTSVANTMLTLVIGAFLVVFVIFSNIVLST